MVDMITDIFSLSFFPFTSGTFFVLIPVCCASVYALFGFVRCLMGR